MTDTANHIIDIADATPEATVWSLAYISEARDPDDLYRLHWALVGAQECGDSPDIGSVVVRWDGWFCHAIEGPCDQVLAFFDGFVLGADDDRTVILAHHGPIDARSDSLDSPLQFHVTASHQETARVEASVRTILAEDLTADGPSPAALLLKALYGEPVAEMAA